MAHIGKVAGSYAKAIFDYLRPQKDGEKKTLDIAEELTSLAAVIDGNEELERVLTTSVFAEQERVAILDDVVKKLKLSEEARRVALIMAQGHRIGYLKPVVERLHRLLQDASNVVPLEVHTAVALDGAEKKKVELKFETLLGKSVEASYVVDPDLIGGLRVTAAGKTYDGSLVGQLRALEESLSAESLSTERLAGGHS